MKKLILILLIALFSSCDNKYDVVVKKTNGISFKYVCRSGSDTANSVRYSFFQSRLVSKVPIGNGKIQGSVIDYYPDGKIKIITNYVEDRAQGINAVFNEKGEIKRRSYYIDNKQVLFESKMVHKDLNIIRKEMTKKTDGHADWAGEEYITQTGEPYFVGRYLNAADSSYIDEYSGIYVDVLVDDTVNVNDEVVVRLNITQPGVVYNPEILVGEFNVNLDSIDTIYYSKPDSIQNTYTFKYRPKKKGNNSFIGKYYNLGIVKDGVYFFDGFYVKE